MLTDEDKVRAIRMGQALQEFFDKNPGTRILRLQGAYEVLVKQDLVERDNRNGTRKFWDYLIKLDNSRALDLIPQLRVERLSNNQWYFESTPSRAIKARNLRPLNKVRQPLTLDMELVRKQIASLPAASNSDLTDLQMQTRKVYARAYDRWTKTEEEVLLEVVKEVQDPIALSKIFLRQPSAIQTRLRERFQVEI